MSAKKVFFAALLAMCSSWCTVQAQDTLGPPTLVTPETKDATPTSTSAPTNKENAEEGKTELSRWITYDRDNCCSGRGGDTPILTEVVMRIGPSLPVGGEYFSRSLETGWMIEGAVRTMFFDKSWMAAWAVELGISNTHNQSNTTNTEFLAHNINQLVTVDSLDRTFVNLAIGREWYLWSPANIADDFHIRVGADCGGRWGAGTVKFVEIRHRTQVIEGVFAAIHADLEIPWGRWTYLAGIRGEYSFTFSNIFASGQGDMQDLTVLFNLGVRY